MTTKTKQNKAKQNKNAIQQSIWKEMCAEIQRSQHKQIVMLSNHTFSLRLVCTQSNIVSFGYDLGSSMTLWFNGMLE